MMALGKIVRIILQTAASMNLLAGACYAQTTRDSGGDLNRLLDRWREKPASPLPTKRSAQPPPSSQEMLAKAWADYDSKNAPYRVSHVTLKSNIPGANRFFDRYRLALQGKNVSAAGLEKFSQTLLRACRNKGYPLCHLEKGTFSEQQETLTLSIDGGRLVNVLYKDAALGTSLPVVGLLAEHRRTLLAANPLSQKTLEQALLLLNDLPGLKAKGVLYKEENGVGLLITLHRKKIDASLTTDNRGSHFVGPVQIIGNVGVHGVLSPYTTLEALAISGTDNQELLAGELRTRTVLNRYGTSLSFNALKSWSEPGYTLEPFALESTSQRIGVNVIHPLLKRRHESATVQMGFSLRNTKTKTLGTLFSEERSRPLMLATTYELADRFGGLTSTSTTLSQGLNILDATASGSRLLSRANGKSDFTKVEFLGSHQHPLGDNVAVTLSLSGQYAFSQLFSSEEFGFGGTALGRGYDASEITGDHGLAGLVEFSYTPVFNQPVWWNSLQFYTSYDIGSVWRIDTNTRDKVESAASAAAGVRLGLWNKAAIDVQIAKPLTRSLGAYSEEDGNDPRLFISMRIAF
jgi:hemolysin activation/secretion protein